MLTKEFVSYLKNPKGEDNDRRNNANINTNNPMGAMLAYGSSLSKKEFLEDIPKKYSLAHNSGFIHIHDLDFYDLTTTCCHISLLKLFENGFGNMRSPKRIASGFMQLCIAIQSNQNDQYGGQSIIDYDVAMGQLCYNVFKKYRADGVGWDEALEKVEKELEQGCESMVHNLNTMNSRAGAQVPFSSINYGLAPAMYDAMNCKGEAFWSYKVIEKTLLATLRGLANGEPARYPIQIYRVKKDINATKTDPYWKLTQMALAVTAKRAYPNYIFIDNAGNDDGFELTDPTTHVGTMGCRTRIFSDLFGKNTSYGRGNASFCSVNLPRLGILSKTEEEFWSRLNYTINLAADQLQYRFTRQCKKSPNCYPTLVGDNVGVDAELCKTENNMWPMLRHFSLSVGFVGLSECLKALSNHNIVIDGYDIIKHMNFKVNRLRAVRKLNYSLFATPAEGLCERFVKLDKEKFGTIEGVTDKLYYTNSFHIPVGNKCPTYTKLSIEGPYHKLCNAGAISYVELDGNVSNNPQAMETIFGQAMKHDVSYFAFNVPLDHCRNCHYDGFIDGESCPNCNSTDISRMRRITGYLALLDKFNDGKKAEEKDRKKHTS